MVSETYLAVYMGVIFLIIGNTALGTQFLMYQRKTGKRYQALFALGADFAKASKSGRTQVRWYFFLPVAVAVVSSAFGIQAMTNGLLSSYYEQQQSSMLVMSFVVVILIVVVEWVYIRAVSSAFGIQAMTNGLLSSYYEQQQSSMLVMSFVVVILIVVVEWVYIRAVMKNSDRNIHALLERKRDE